jgi:glutaminyl-peptide cyclotransferase
VYILMRGNFQPNLQIEGKHGWHSDDKHCKTNNKFWFLQVPEQYFFSCFAYLFRLISLFRHGIMKFPQNRPVYCAFILFSLLAACQNTPDRTQASVTPEVETPAIAQLNYNIIAKYPHDTASFTQGLLFHEGKLYESTGGSAGVNDYLSWVGTVDLNSGKAIKKIPLDKSLFGEGIAVLNEKLYQLTWQDRKAFQYNAKTLQIEKTFELKTDGWGLTQDGKSLILSDGSSNLYFIRPTDFGTDRIVSVTLQGQPIGNLNELEYHNGYVYANRWQSNDIVKINAENGKVEAVADMSALVKQFPPALLGNEKYRNGEGVLNGIAFHPEKQTWFITGKLWPYIFEVSFK